MQQYLLTFFMKKKKKTEETQLMHLILAEGTSVSIHFRFLAMKMTHYHSVSIDKFIS